jgi:hypothetical protein
MELVGRVQLLVRVNMPNELQNYQVKFPVMLGLEYGLVHHSHKKIIFFLCLLCTPSTYYNILHLE